MPPTMRTIAMTLTGFMGSLRLRVNRVECSNRETDQGRADEIECQLTFDMSGGAKAAKQALGRPLDGGVRFLLHECKRAQGMHSRNGELEAEGLECLWRDFFEAAMEQRMRGVTKAHRRVASVVDGCSVPDNRLALENVERNCACRLLERGEDFDSDCGCSTDDRADAVSAEVQRLSFDQEVPFESGVIRRPDADEVLWQRSGHGLPNEAPDGERYKGLAKHRGT